MLQETFGVIIYQEQVMQAAQVLSGYSLGEADMLRRAMGKKIKAEMDAQRARFVEGAVERDIPKAKADEIFDLLAKFADYGFNKSHAAAYALIAYQTAYLKANYPVEFLAASMTLDKSNTDKLAEFRNEAQRLGIKVEPPSINRSGVDFEVDARPGGGAIRYALSAIKGAGEGQVAAHRGGARAAAVRVARRLRRPRSTRARSTRRCSKAWPRPGAFDELEPDRARAFGGDGADAGDGQPHARTSAQAGQSALFGGGETAACCGCPTCQPWSAAERLRREFDADRLLPVGPSARRVRRVLDG